MALFVSFPMTDPCEEVYIYLRIYHKDQLNVGKYAGPIHLMGCDFFPLASMYGILIYKNSKM